MVDDKRPVDRSANAERVWQLVMAFGQGAGTMMATANALSKAHLAYGGLVHSQRWESDRLVAIEFGRALGRAAAAHALNDCRCVIDEVDIEFAINAVSANQAEPLGPCPLTERLSKK